MSERASVLEYRHAHLVRHMHRQLYHARDDLHKGTDHSIFVAGHNLICPDVVCRKINRNFTELIHLCWHLAATHNVDMIRPYLKQSLTLVDVVPTTRSSTPSSIITTTQKGRLFNISSPTRWQPFPDPANV